MNYKMEEIVAACWEQWNSPRVHGGDGKNSFRNCFDLCKHGQHCKERPKTKSGTSVVFWHDDLDMTEEQIDNSYEVIVLKPLRSNNKSIRALRRSD